MGQAASLAIIARHRAGVSHGNMSNSDCSHAAPMHVVMFLVKITTNLRPIGEWGPATEQVGQIVNRWASIAQVATLLLVGNSILLLLVAGLLQGYAPSIS